MTLSPRILFLITLLFINLDIVHAGAVPSPLVDSDWLKNNLDKVVVLDIRADTKSFTSKPVFRKDKKSGKLTLLRVGGHIPDARLVDYKKIRTRLIIDGNEIDKLLLPKAQFEKLMQSTGLNKGDAIVIVSKGESNKDAMNATRLYWSLKYYGHDDMAILNGGMADWLRSGGKISIDESKQRSGNWVASAERKDILASSADVKQALGDKTTQLVDTRSIAQYLGTYRKSYVYKKGHIPGARIMPNELLTGPGNKPSFTTAEDLKQLSSAMGIDYKGNMITYCNSGHLASGSWFLYSEVLGNKNVKLYDGSMHQWTKEKNDTVKMKME